MVVSIDSCNPIKITASPIETTINELDKHSNKNELDALFQTRLDEISRVKLKLKTSHASLGPITLDGIANKQPKTRIIM